MQQQRRDNVDDIEINLLQHQLALFPHLEYSVPPEVCARYFLFANIRYKMDIDRKLSHIQLQNNYSSDQFPPFFKERQIQ